MSDRIRKLQERNARLSALGHVTAEQQRELRDAYAERDHARLDLVEDSWYSVTKGELWLTPDVDGTEGDVDLARLVLGMWETVDRFTSTVDVEQTDLEVDRDRGIAMRIAEALALLHFGGRWESQS